MTWEKYSLLKVREQLEDNENSHKEERLSQKRQEDEHINSPNPDYVNRKSFKKHIIFNGSVETEFLGTNKGNKKGKLGESPGPIALEMHCNNAINYSSGST